MDLISLVPYLVLCASLVALGFAALFYIQMRKKDEGTKTMKQIALYVRKGAMAYLKQQYKVVIIVFIILAAIFAILWNQPSESLGSLRFPDWRLLQRSCRIHRNENSHLCLRTHGLRRFPFPQQGPETGFPQRSSNGSYRCWSGPS